MEIYGLSRRLGTGIAALTGITALCYRATPMNGVGVSLYTNSLVGPVNRALFYSPSDYGGRTTA
jgi:hypothetical protein